MRQRTPLQQHVSINRGSNTRAKRLTLSVAALLMAVVSISSLILPTAALAEIGAVDAVPAATLLLPYFEVDLNDSNGWRTLLSVNNASAPPALAHLTVWTEFSVPVLDFDIYLSGYDVQTISLEEILVWGKLPQTGSALSNEGPFSLANTNFPGCSDGSVAGQIPNYTMLPASLLRGVQEALSGQEITAPGFAPGLCAAAPGKETTLRGYITIDSVTECSQLFPNSDGYFVDGGNGVADNRNVLWGDYFLMNVAQEFATGYNLVHVEADDSLSVGAGACDPTDYDPSTFYCRYTAAFGADNREALPSEFAVRYVNGGGFDAGTDLMVYRNPNRPGFLVDCGDVPWDMAMSRLVAFDEMENPLGNDETPDPSSPFGEEPERFFPYETNRVSVGESLETPADFGWLLLDFDEAVAPGESNQAWVTAMMSAEGRFSVGFDAIHLNRLTASSR